MSGRTFRPAETYITRTATGNNMSFKLTALIDNGKSHLPGGMSGNMLIGQTSNKFVGVAVPQKAVWSPSSGGSCVWTIDNGGRVCRRNVVTGHLLGGGMIEICSGLKPANAWPQQVKPCSMKATPWPHRPLPTGKEECNNERRS